MLRKPCHWFGTRLMLIFVFVMGMIGVEPTKLVLAATLTVINTNDSGSGSLRSAILNAASGDTIKFDPALAGGTIPLQSDLIISKDLTIDGSGLAPQITISGGNVAHLVIQNSPFPPTVTISDLTISDGYTSGSGGAINAGLANLTLINSTLRNNHALGSGGAVSVSTLTMKNTVLYQNQADISGGAVAIAGNSFTTISNSTMTQNQAGSGGAFFIQGNSMTEVFNSTIAGNTASSANELFLSGNGTLQLSNTIVVCIPADGGCILQSGLVSLPSTNSTIGIGTLLEFGLAGLADNGGPTRTMALLPGSPFIDAGNDSICANSPVNNLDQRGVTRPQGLHCDIGAFEMQDVTPPAVISIDPQNEALNVPIDQAITVTFSENIDPTTVNDLSIFLTPFTSNTHIPATFSSAGKVVTLTPNTPLELGTTFLIQVTGGVKDLSGNALDQIYLSTFTTGPNAVRDTTTMDFAAGTLGACYLSKIENGEVTLSPLIGEEFSGAGLPVNWSQLPLNNGTATVSNDAVSADGAMAYYSNATFTADHRLKFEATFRAGQFQRVGLVGNTDFSGQWAAFSTNNTTDKLYAVTSDGQTTRIPGEFIGTKHTYEMIWLANAVHFYVDNSPTPSATHNVTLTNLRPMLSDSTVDGQSVTVEWMHFTPYSSPCTFISRVFDAGKMVDWLNLASWTWGSQGVACIASLPPGPPLCTPNYGFTIETRTGNTSTPNGTWSAWQAAVSSIASPNGRYMQYRATLSADTPGATQQLFSVVATYLAPPPAIYRVATNGVADPSCGVSWSNPCDLQYALTTRAGPGDEVWVRAGVYKPGNDRTSSFILRNGVAVYGGFAGTEMSLSQRNYQANVTVLSGDIGVQGDKSDNSYHVVVGSHTNYSAILDGFTVTGGNADSNLLGSDQSRGGGMYNLMGSPSLTNVILRDNYAVFGGGMNNDSDSTVPPVPNGQGSDPVLTNVSFINNSATEGGGLRNEDNSSPTLTNVIFDGNRAVRAGGGIENLAYNQLVLTNITFMNNRVISDLDAGGGGGLMNTLSNPTLTNVTFSNNSAPEGGGMFNAYSSPSLVNVTFSQNTATHDGGGISNQSSSHPTLTNVTFSANTASTVGGGIYNDALGSNATIRNGIFYGNVGGEIYNVTGQANVTYSIVQGGYTGTGNIDANPLLEPLQDNGGFTQTMALRAGSRAINAGDDANCPATDQRGVTRPQGRHCDIGAYEYKKKHGNDTTGVFRPSNGLLYLKNTHETGFADVAINYGIPGDYPVVGDWDGDGTVTIGIYRNGSFYLRNSNTIGFAEIVFPFGQPGDQPIAGDWNGDGIDTIGVYRSSNGQFLLRNSNSAGAAEASFFLGNVGDVGIAGDWNGDGMDTTGVFRPSNGVLFLKNTNATGFADLALNYGIPGDKPVTGDWDNDGVDTIGVYRNGKFMLRNSNTIGFAEIVFGLGNPGDMPIAGNWDGLP